MRRANPSERPYRRSVRLPGYDYASAGAYFITVVVQRRACVFGQIVAGEMQRNDAGHMVAAVWQTLPGHFPSVTVDAFIVMPNHFHAVVVILELPTANRAPTRGAPTAYEAGEPRSLGTRDEIARHPTLGAVVGAFKSITTLEYIRGVKASRWSEFSGRLWQRNYYEHIIRTDDALNKIRNYIHTNPQRWFQDRENPDRHADDPIDYWLDTGADDPP